MNSVKQNSFYNYVILNKKDITLSIFI